MKTLTLTLVILFSSGLTHSTAQSNVQQEKHQKVITHLVGDHYSMTVISADGSVLQEGFYLKSEERYIEHGIWKLYDYNTYDLITKVKFDKGVKVWIETEIDGEFLRFTQQEIEVNRLNKRVSVLEKQFAETDHK